MTADDAELGIDTFVCAGVAVESESVCVSLEPGGIARSFSNTEAGLGQMVGLIRSLGVDLVLMQAGGGQYGRVADRLTEESLPLAVTSPRRLRDFARDEGLRTDSPGEFARAIARHAAIERPRPGNRASRAERRLSELVVRRDQLVDLHRDESGRLDQVDEQSVLDDIAASVDDVGVRIARLSELIHNEIESGSEFADRRELLLTAPGVDLDLVAALITYLPELGSVDSRVIVARGGVVPSRTGERGRQGRVRRALSLTIVHALEVNPDLKAKYDHLTAGGKPHRVALFACMRQLLVALNGMIKNGRPWRNGPSQRHEPMDRGEGMGQGRRTEPE